MRSLCDPARGTARDCKQVEQVLNRKSAAPAGHTFELRGHPKAFLYQPTWETRLGPVLTAQEMVIMGSDTAKLFATWAIRSQVPKAPATGKVHRLSGSGLGGLHPQLKI